MLNKWKNLVRSRIKDTEIHHQILWLYLQNRDHYLSSFLHLTLLIQTPEPATIPWLLGDDKGQWPHGLPTSAFAPHHIPVPVGQLHLVTLAFQPFLTLTNPLPYRTAAWRTYGGWASPPSCTCKASTAETPPKTLLSKAGLPTLLSQQHSQFWICSGSSSFMVWLSTRMAGITPASLPLCPQCLAQQWMYIVSLH